VEALSKQGVELSFGDVTEPATLGDALRGVDAIVHMASKMGQAGDRNAFIQVNVDGTRNLLQAAKGQKLQRFIHISSLSVITGNQDQNGSDESAPYRATGENYADTKIEAEIQVLQRSRENALPVVVLRPGFIYGPGDRAFLPAVIDNLKAGKVVLIDHGKKLLNLTYVDNLVDAIESALTTDNILGEVFNLTDGEEVSKKRFFDAVADQISVPRPTKSIPFGLAKFLCEFFTTFYRLLRIKSPPRLSRMKLRFMGMNQWFDISKAKTRLHYQPKVHFDEGMQRAVVWYQKHEDEFKHLPKR
jgi:nucleoside-diphosphate-sugar epimerase